MAEGFYHLGDYVYMEVDPAPAPYKVCRLEELSKTPEGRIEALVTSMYRRRDLPTSLAQLADRFSVDFEEEEGCLWSTESLSAKEKHQLKHRELFLCRDYETYEISLIRGKCLVTLLCEVETPESYLKRPDTFYYSLIYDPQARTLQPDKNSIRIGDKYQAQVPPGLAEKESKTPEETATPLWKPNTMSNKEIDQYMVLARSVGTFARAMITSKTFQPSLHASAAAASRDVTLLHAMTSLHRSGYDLATAVAYLVPQGGPLLCRDEMENWTAEEANVFERALQACGKDFHEIQKDHLHWKSIKSVVEYYYMWKTSDRYTYTKQQKFLERQNKLKDFAIKRAPSSHQAKGGGGTPGPGSGPGGKPSGGDPGHSPSDLQQRKGPSPSHGSTGSGGPSSVGGNGKGGSGDAVHAKALIPSAKPCECCKVSSSMKWHSWGPPEQQLKLCNDCWMYWRKYAGFKLATKWETSRFDEACPSYLCLHCNRYFTRKERLLTHQRDGCSVATKSAKKFRASTQTTQRIFVMRPKSATFFARKVLGAKQFRRCGRKLGRPISLSLLKDRDEPSRRIPRCYRIRDASWHRVARTESTERRKTRLLTLDNQILDLNATRRTPNQKLLHSPQLLIQKHSRRFKSKEEAMGDAVLKAHQEQLKRALPASKSIVTVDVPAAAAPLAPLPLPLPLPPPPEDRSTSDEKKEQQAPESSKGTFLLVSLDNNRKSALAPSSAVAAAVNAAAGATSTVNVSNAVSNAVTAAAEGKTIYLLPVTALKGGNVMETKKKKSEALLETKKKKNEALLEAKKKKNEALLEAKRKKKEKTAKSTLPSSAAATGASTAAATGASTAAAAATGTSAAAAAPAAAGASAAAGSGSGGGNSENGKNVRKRMAASAPESDNATKRTALDAACIKTRRVSPRLGGGGGENSPIKKSKSSPDTGKPSSSQSTPRKNEKVGPAGDERVFISESSPVGKKRRLEVLPVLRKAARRPCVEPPVPKLPKKERTLNGNDESDLIEGDFAPTTSGNAAEPIVID